MGEAGLVDDGERVEALGEDPFPGVQEEPGRLVRGDALRRRRQADAAPAASLAAFPRATRTLCGTAKDSTVVVPSHL